MKVLVVDDDPSQRKLLTVALQAAKLEVQSVADGRDALGVLASRKWLPDVMVLDYSMPEFDGGDVLEAMSAIHELRQIPVVIVTALDSVPPEAKRRAALVLRKPVDMKELVAALIKLVPA